jgi:hypothetical protein
MDILDEELLELWRAFQSNKLEYIMVGGFATNLHGFHRTTADVDIWMKNTANNRIALRKSLAECKHGDFPELERVEFVPGWSSIRLTSGIELDIMTHLKGFAESDFDECFSLASEAEVHGVTVRFLHLNHLIIAKEASNREKDKIDLIALYEIKKLRNL